MNPTKKSLRDFALPLAFSAVCTVTAVSANAQPQLFIDIPGTTGASQDDEFKGQTEVLNWSWGVYRPYTPGTSGGSLGTPGFREVTLEKSVDSATVGIQTLVLNGNLSTVTMRARIPGISGELAYQVELQGARITSSELSDADDGLFANEVVTIAYDRYCYTPFIQDIKFGGTTPGTPVCWDLMKNSFF